MGGLFSLRSRLGPPALVRFPSPSAPPTRASPRPLELRPAPPLAARRVRQSSLDLLRERTGRGGRYSARGAPTADCRALVECSEEQRGRETASPEYPPTSFFLNVLIFFGKRAPRPGRRMRQAVAPSESVENNSFAVTNLLKICSHCQRLRKKVKGGLERKARHWQVDKCCVRFGGGAVSPL